MQNLEENFRPIIVCLCGSTRYKDAFERENEAQTLAGKIVLSVGFFAGVMTAEERARRITPKIKLSLDELHIQKIELADEVRILNVNGYIGDSTKRELWYASMRSKTITFIDPRCPTRSEVLSWFANWKAWQDARTVAAGAA